MTLRVRRLIRPIAFVVAGFAVGAGVEIYRYDSGGTGFFACDPGVPNGAIVTTVQFTVSDLSEAAG